MRTGVWFYEKESEIRSEEDNRKQHKEKAEDQN